MKHTLLRKIVQTRTKLDELTKFRNWVSQCIFDGVSVYWFWTIFMSVVWPMHNGSAEWWVQMMFVSRIWHETW